ncbi:MAG: serine/threonine-protein kinase, partial [Cyanobacteria bacterium P01_D01_bin.116]
MQVYCTRNHANSPNNRFCTVCGEPLPLPVGEVINNRYKIVRQLGQGGFGRTYLAEDIKQSHQKCVLKEFAPQVEENEDLQKAKELFEREASVLKQLQHSQIPRLHSSLQVKLLNKDFFFLVQDYVEGENYQALLEKRLNQGRCFSEKEVFHFLTQILPVLDYIHSKDVVHRDISPDNLVLRKTDNLPVLIDFGGVKQLPASQGLWFTKLPVNRTLLGKKGYAPEEQLRQGKAFHSSDLYSLGVSALVLLAGEEPQQLYDSYHGKWRWGEKIKVSTNFEAILKKMLAYKPNDRYQNSQQLLKDLQSSTPPSTPAPTSNKNVSKLHTAIVAPGSKAATQFHKKTQAFASAIRLPIWLRPFFVSLVSTSVVVLVFAGTWA